ncbi:hypothetical protein A2U01_0072977, partial [Trifolium medium]|nr:hypothetical protein [Trifolium medium]
YQENYQINVDKVIELGEVKVELEKVKKEMEELRVNSTEEKKRLDEEVNALKSDKGLVTRSQLVEKIRVLA